MFEIVRNIRSYPVLGAAMLLGVLEFVALHRAQLATRSSRAAGAHADEVDG